VEVVVVVAGGVTALRPAWGCTTKAVDHDASQTAARAVRERFVLFL
jgi:hypothetical protein